MFGDAGTPNLTSDARAALARLSRLASFVVAYPLPGDDPALARQFDAVVRHLGESIEALGDAHGAARFSANLDELSWLDGGDPNDYIDQERDTCTRLWWQVVNCMDFRDVRGVRDALEIELPPDWRDWAWASGSAACCITISFVRNRRAAWRLPSCSMPAKCTATGSATARSAFAHATGCGVCDVKPTMRGT